MDRDTGGESGHLLKMILRPRETFLAGVPIHLRCPDPPRLTVVIWLLDNVTHYFLGPVENLQVVGNETNLLLYICIQ